MDDLNHLTDAFHLSVTTVPICRWLKQEFVGCDDVSSHTFEHVENVFETYIVRQRRAKKKTTSKLSRRIVL